VNVLVWNFEK